MVSGKSRAGKLSCEKQTESKPAMVKGIRPLFGVEVDGERRNSFCSLAKAKELETALVAQGCKVVIFPHSDAEINFPIRLAQGGLARS
jgi:hypothetical protein